MSRLTHNNPSMKAALQARKLILAATSPEDVLEVWLTVVEKAKTPRGGSERKLFFEMLLGKTPTEAEQLERIEKLETMLESLVVPAQSTSLLPGDVQHG